MTILVSYKGEWKPSVSYIANDVVSYGDGWFKCIEDCIDEPPPSSKWANYAITDGQKRLLNLFTESNSSLMGLISGKASAEELSKLSDDVDKVKGQVSLNETEISKAVETIGTKLDANATAVNSNKLGNVDSSEYALKTDVPSRLKNDSDTVRIDGEGNIYNAAFIKGGYYILTQGDFTFRLNYTGPASWPGSYGYEREDGRFTLVYFSKDGSVVFDGTKLGPFDIVGANPEHGDVLPDFSLGNSVLQFHPQVTEFPKEPTDSFARESEVAKEVERAQAAEEQLTTKSNELDTNKLDKTAVVAPSASATAGQAADAKAVNDALESKVDNIEGVIEHSLEVINRDVHTILTGNAIVHGQIGDDATVMLPNKSGTFALISDIEDAVKGKVGSFASVGGASATVENGVANLHDFFTNSNSLLNGQLAYKRNATGLKDRAFNTLSFDGTEYNLSTALEAVTPTASGQPRDLLIVATATAATTISFTAGTIKGDKPTIDGSGTWLITLTEYASGVWYCRQIKMEDAA